ncbi:MAG: glycosyltransferase family 4 protein [Coleofasciculus sp. D1-CHI-01]|uniref:glycosyltransferase family 4 protein n=1 Tax=Coleofasciculus sp. D1-CHI-01 TaxID=3068482 RepID=UPI0032F1549C
MSKPLRLLYAPGPGDVISTYHHWVKGEDDPSQVSITYSSQFYEVCRTLDAQAYVITPTQDKKFFHDSQFTLEGRPIPQRGASGIVYHLGQLGYEFGLITSALRFRANVIVVGYGGTNWFVLSLFPWLGIRVIPSLHCLFWRKYTSLGRAERLKSRLSRNFFAKDCTAILVASDDITEQVKQITAGQHQPVVEFLPTYRRQDFAQIDQPDESHSPFRVMFAGRIERNKGVFDLLEIAKRFVAEGREDIIWNICGKGSALESLRLAAKEAGIDSSFVCHGHCNKSLMRQMFNQAHVIIVPTKTDFVEGFNQVVVEGILAGRPVVTSAVCPALSYVQDGVVEVPPDDIKGYGDALLRLCDDREFYEQKRRGCLALQEQFYDSSQGWGAKLKSILMAIQENQEAEEMLDVKGSY